MGSLPGNRIKPKTIAAGRIKPKTLTAKQFKPKTLTGSQIKPHSLTGAQIKGDTLTGVAAASLTSVQYSVATVTLATFSSKGTTATAACPVGTFVIGGGATLNKEENAFINDDGPTPSRAGWTATGFAYSSDRAMTVTAICVAVKSPVGSGPSTAPDYQPAG